ncbi:MAG: CehA/McbA family metallohydrolase [Candidatus Edwardsbacteria bacterium]|nr:CehA/McbA family metallohydrolase [Candidatus Edwardsbacteria bacterium]
MKNFVLWIMILAAVALATSAPAHAQYKCFYGNLHSHTSYSDGQSVPEVAYAYARITAGIHVLALTDHNNSPDDLNELLYQRTRYVADSMTVSGSFVALAGQEIGKTSGFGHIACFDAPALSPYFNSWSDLTACYQWIREQNKPAMYCHPMLFSPNDFALFLYYPAYDKAMDMLEVVNQDGNYEKQYLLALLRGWQIGASANQDNHYHDWGTASSDGLIPLTGIWADTLTREGILEALQARRTFAVRTKTGTGRIQLSLRADDRWMGERYLREAGSVELEIYARSPDDVFKRLDLYSDGVVIDSLLVNQKIVSWRLSKPIGVGAHYFFVKVRQDGGGTAWSSPAFVEVPPQDKEGKVFTWPTPVTESARIVFAPIDGVTSVTVDIYNLAGARVWHAASTNPMASVYWDGRDAGSKLMPNGVYIILVEQQSPAQTKLSKGKTMVSR